MCEARRGYVVLLQGGDPEISGALAAGTLTAIEARGDEEPHPALRATFPTGGRLAGDEAAEGRPSETEPVDWGEVAKLVRVAVGNTKTQEDYLIMRAAAEQEYSVRRGGTLRRLAEALTVAYGLIVCGLSAAFHAQDHILGG